MYSGTTYTQESMNGHMSASGLYSSDAGYRRPDVVTKGAVLDHSDMSLLDGSGQHVGINQMYTTGTSSISADSHMMAEDAPFAADFESGVRHGMYDESNGETIHTTNASHVVENGMTSIAGADQNLPIIPAYKYQLQYDTNPTVVRKGAVGGPIHMQQKVHIRLLKPPAVPAPGPLVIKEVRDAQLPPAPPLVIRQMAPRPATPPPIVLREKPPRPPVIPGAQVISKRVPPPPAPKRQVIVERFPPLPPKPRDVIIERWLPYATVPKRKIIYQRAAMSQVYHTPKNMIIHHDQQKLVMSRQFEKHGVVEMDPRLYISRYGGSLLDSSVLVDSARRVGVTEDIGVHSISYPSNHHDHHHQSSISDYQQYHSSYLDPPYNDLIMESNTVGLGHPYESLNFGSQSVDSSVAGESSLASTAHNSSVFAARSLSSSAAATSAAGMNQSAGRSMLGMKRQHRRRQHYYGDCCHQQQHHNQFLDHSTLYNQDETSAYDPINCSGAEALLASTGSEQLYTESGFIPSSSVDYNATSGIITSGLKESQIPSPSQYIDLDHSQY